MIGEIMKENSQKKKLKKASKDERIFMTWGIGFMWLIIAALLSDIYSISLTLLAAAAFAMFTLSVLLKFLRKLRENREARTGSTLAQIETT